MVFEVPVYLEYLKLARVYSLEAAVIYNTVYFVFLIQLYKSFYEYDYETMGAPTAFEAFKDMFLVYNLIMHVFILPINLMIIFKEFETANIQVIGEMVNYDFGEESTSEYSLGNEDA